MQQSYSAYQGPASSYNFQSVTDYTSPYSGSFQESAYPSTHGPHHQPGLSSGGDYYGNGAGHYPSGVTVVPVKLTTDGYGSSCYENSNTHMNSNNHGSPHHQGHGSSHSSYGQGHGSPHNQGHNSPYGPGKPNGIGGAITNQINKLTHGHNKYGSGSPNYGHNPNAFNHGYQHPQSWTVKGFGDDD
ncbi:hypothetical protein L1987_11306 [Smallanthus sonchifolius]|uniref:Uncharacterized protein n=1 Tax=Smallanthus sonchifolius TaxID=185202 RepID=A0ACB9JB34_9ASTR|nr:hypothetical protein L1987_11306 [Smallanthus sonchifolius]